MASVLFAVVWMEKEQAHMLLGTEPKKPELQNTSFKESGEWDAPAKFYLALFQDSLGEGDLVVALSQAGKFQAAIKIAQRAKRADFKAYYLMNIAKSQARFGEMKESEVTYGLAAEAGMKIQNRFTTGGERQSALMTIAISQADSGFHNQALVLAQKIGSPYHSVRVKMHIINRLIESGERKKAVEFLKQAETQVQKVAFLHELFGVLLYEDIATAYRKLGMNEHAMQMLGLARERALKRHGTAMKAQSLIRIAGTQSNWGEEEQAKLTFGMAKAAYQKAISEAMSRNPLNDLSAIARHRSNSGEQKQAIIIFHLVVEAAQKIPDANTRTETLMGIAETIKNSKDKKQAVAILVLAAEAAQQIENPRSRAFALMSVAEPLAKLNAHKHAATALGQAVKAADGDALVHLVLALRNTAEVLSKRGEIDQAMTQLEMAKELAQRIEDGEGKTRFLMGIAKIQAECGDHEKAVMTLVMAAKAALKMRHAEEKVNDLSGIGKALVKSGGYNQALATFELAKEFAPKIRVVRARASALIGIANSFAELDNEKQAMATLKLATKAALQIASLMSRSYVLTNIAEKQFELGENEKGLSNATYDLAVETAHKMAGAADKKESLKRIAAHKANLLQNRAEKMAYRHGAKAITLWQLGDPKQSIALFKKALDEAKKIDHANSRDITLGHIAMKLGKIGEIMQAIDAANEIKGADHKSEILSNIAMNLVKTGEIMQAIDIAKKIEISGRYAGTLKDIAIALAKSGNKAQASEIFKQAIETAQKINNPQGLAETLMQIAKAQTEAGDTMQAVATLELAAKKYQKLRARTLMEIAEGLADLGEQRKAVATLGLAASAGRRRLGAWDKSETLRDVGIAFAEKGALNQAAATLGFATEAAQKINGAYKIKILKTIGVALVLKPMGKTKKNSPETSAIHRIKSSFTPEEKKTAEQIVEALKAAGQKK